MTKWLKGITLIGLIAFAMSGCLFETRPAAPPDEDDDFITLDVPSAVFQAITQSLTSLQDANYERAISTRFVFSPTQQDSLDQTFTGTDVYADWNKTVELEVLGLLLSDAKNIDVAFANSVLINQSTFVRFNVDYRLAVVDNATPTDTTVYAGIAQWDVRNEGGNWRLTFWNEIETVPNRSTWGYLKGILRLQLNP